MNPRRTGAIATLLAATLSACSGQGTSTSAAGTGDEADTQALSTTANSGAEPGTLPRGDETVTLDPAEFTTKIDNPYWPMEPGTRWTYREGDKKVVVVVTSETKKIANGVVARVIRDTVTENGEITEDTLDWYAQDKAGNIWYLGEDTAEFGDGRITTKAGSFEAGVDGALPGIAIPARPTVGQRYRQEFYRGKAEDNGEVLSTTEMASVPHGFFKDMLLTKDTITIEPNVLEYKLYAPGVGPVLAIGVAGGAGREELVNVDRAPAGAGTGPLGRPNG